jgi:hypothetical protein
MKEYKAIKEILDDLINREIGKMEAEKAINEFKAPNQITATTEGVHARRSALYPEEETILGLLMVESYPVVNQMFPPGTKVKITIDPA